MRREDLFTAAHKSKTHAVRFRANRVPIGIHLLATTTAPASPVSEGPAELPTPSCSGTTATAPDPSFCADQQQPDFDSTAEVRLPDTLLLELRKKRSAILCFSDRGFKETRD
jgi:hypothetical protein